MEEHDDEEEGERRRFPVRERREPERLDMSLPQGIVGKKVNPRRRKREQAAAATPRREEIRKRGRVHPPGSIRTQSGWRRERWATTEEEED